VGAIDADAAVGRRLFELEVKFLSLAHVETDKALDLETLALEPRPKTHTERLQALVEEQAGAPRRNEWRSDYAAVEDEVVSIRPRAD
jgi:hypothetical protein